MKTILLVLMIILSPYLYANTLSCERIAVLYAETGKMHLYTEKEKKQFYPLRIKTSENTVWLDMPSGRQSRFDLQDTINGEKRYFSRDNAYLRKPKKAPKVFCKESNHCNLWYFDLNINGALQSTVLNCDSTSSEAFMQNLYKEADQELVQLDAMCGDDIDCRIKQFQKNTEALYKN